MLINSQDKAQRCHARITCESAHDTCYIHHAHTSCVHCIYCGVLPHVRYITDSPSERFCGDKMNVPSLSSTLILFCQVELGKIVAE